MQGVNLAANTGLAANGMKLALITGITGQDGSYLTGLLLAKGYTVHGIVRRSSVMTRTRLEHIHGGRQFEGERLYLEYGDMTDGSALRHIISRVEPEEVYNLAAQSQVRVSFDLPEYTMSSREALRQTDC